MKPNHKSLLERLLLRIGLSGLTVSLWSLRFWSVPLKVHPLLQELFLDSVFPSTTKLPLRPRT